MVLLLMFQAMAHRAASRNGAATIASTARILPILDLKSGPQIRTYKANESMGHIPKKTASHSGLLLYGSSSGDSIDKNAVDRDASTPMIRMRPSGDCANCSRKKIPTG